MNVLYLLLLLLAAVCFLLSALGVRTPRVNFLTLGLFFWVLVPLINHLERV